MDKGVGKQVGRMVILLKNLLILKGKRGHISIKLVGTQMTVNVEGLSQDKRASGAPTGLCKAI